jgi:hypothetical protein
MNRNELSKSKLHPYQRKCQKCCKFVPTIITVYSNLFCLLLLIVVVAWNFQNIGYSKYEFTNPKEKNFYELKYSFCLQFNCSMGMEFDVDNTT